MGGADERLWHTGAFQHFLGEREADAGAFGGVRAVAFPLFRGLLDAPVVAAVGRLVQNMERIGGDAPLAAHRKRADQRMRFGSPAHVADALHVALSGQQPDITDEKCGDARPALSASQLQPIRPAGRDIGEFEGECSAGYPARKPSVARRQRGASLEISFLRYSIFKKHQRFTIEGHSDRAYLKVEHFVIDMLVFSIQDYLMTFKSVYRPSLGSKLFSLRFSSEMSSFHEGSPPTDKLLSS